MLQIFPSKYIYYDLGEKTSKILIIYSAFFKLSSFYSKIKYVCTYEWIAEKEYICVDQRSLWN